VAANPKTKIAAAQIRRKRDGFEIAIGVGAMTGAITAALVASIVVILFVYRSPDRGSMIVRRIER
jgi:hypothetical protein